MRSWLAGKHVARMLPGYVEQELTPKERARVERHLAQCATCRQLLKRLHTARLLMADAIVVSAPDALWNGIEARLPAEPFAATQNVLHREIAAFTRNTSSAGRLAAGQSNRRFISRLTRRLSFTAALVIVLILITNLAGNKREGELLQYKSTNPNPQNSASWRVRSLRGMPLVGNAKISNVTRMRVGDNLVTASGDSARVEVADIGQVEVAPNSRLRLVETGNRLHRLALDRGELSAHVSAPPRLFLVDTPSAVAVDLGCAYTLKVDAAGNTRLQVTTGHVALECGAHGVEVPAGAMCLTRKGVGTGTPFFAKAPAKLKAALQQFDFENASDAALTAILQSARMEDTMTLFYLLPRVSPAQRERVIKGLLAYFDFPNRVTRAGIRKLDPRMMTTWKEQMENFWD